MWLFLSDAFLSIVQDKTDPNVLVVRARRAGDIESVFPGALVRSINGRDYQFRAHIDRESVATAMFEQVQNLTHTNFKDSVINVPYHNACSTVWSVMARLQPKPPYSSNYDDRNMRVQQVGRAKRSQSKSLFDPVNDYSILDDGSER